MILVEQVNLGKTSIVTIIKDIFFFIFNETFGMIPTCGKLVNTSSL